MKVPQKDADRYEVRVTEACPPDLFDNVEKPKLEDFDNEILDKTLLENDEKSKEIRKVYPSMKPEAAWFAGRGRLALGMTPLQVSVAWGKPIGEEVFVENGRRRERLLFGDPMYGLNISCRFADFEDGRLVDFKENKTLEKLYMQEKEGR